jgi:ABC-type glycerol-3-phosphate transport system substrate-binding protein
MKQNAAKGVYDNLKFSAGPGNTIIQYTQAYVLSGAVKDKNKQEGVKAFMNYITDADRLTDLSNSSGSVFVPKMNAVEDKYVNEIVGLRDKAKVITPSFESAVSTDAAANFSPYLEKLLGGDLSTKDFVSQLQKDNKK